MRKNRYKFLFAACIAVMSALLIIGCRKEITSENIFKTMQGNIAKAESVSGDITLEADIVQDIGNMEVSMDMDFESVKEPYAFHMKGTAEIGGLALLMGSDALDLELYQVKEDSQIISYVCSQGQWMKQAVDVQENLPDIEMLQKLAKIGDNFEESSEKTEVSGRECFELKGKIGGDILEGLLNKDMLWAVGGEDVVDEEAAEQLELPCTIDIYSDTFLPARLTLDLEDVLGAVYKGMSGIETSGCRLTIEYKEYDKTDEIKLPEETKDAIQL